MELNGIRENFGQVSLTPDRALIHLGSLIGTLRLSRVVGSHRVIAVSSWNLKLLWLIRHGHLN